MRHARVTYEGAYHHIISRGLRGEPVLLSSKLKNYFLNLLAEAKNKYRIKIFAYCLMDNHYHLVLQNSSGRLGDFMRYLNGTFGKYYRYLEGGKGYVFQDRYKSTLIQDETYMIMVLTYVLLNPVRAGIVKDPYQYIWSSISDYFSEKPSGLVDHEFVEGVIGGKDKLDALFMDWISRDKSPDVKRTRFGDVIGNTEFVGEIERRFNRRKSTGENLRRRKKDYPFVEPSEVIMGFEKEFDVKVEKIDTSKRNGKRLRGELLVRLRDEAGLKYSDIIRMPIFKNLRYSSLGKIYKRAKERIKREKERRDKNVKKSTSVPRRGRGVKRRRGYGYKKNLS